MQASPSARLPPPSEDPPPWRRLSSSLLATHTQSILPPLLTPPTILHLHSGGVSPGPHRVVTHAHACAHARTRGFTASPAPGSRLLAPGPRPQHRALAALALTLCRQLPTSPSEFLLLYLPTLCLISIRLLRLCRNPTVLSVPTSLPHPRIGLSTLTSLETLLPALITWSLKGLWPSLLDLSAYLQPCD